MKLALLGPYVLRRAEALFFVQAAADGSTGTKQFSAIPGPSYVSAGIPGRGYRPSNAFPLQNPGVAIPNMGPIKGANANGVCALMLC